MRPSSPYRIVCDPRQKQRAVRVPMAKQFGEPRAHADLNALIQDLKSDEFITSVYHDGVCLCALIEVRRRQHQESE